MRLTSQNPANRRRTRNLALLAALVGLAYLPPLVGLFVGAWPFHDDGITLFNVWRGLGREALRSGIVPLWNPYTFCGMPLAANNQTAYFYPPNLLYWFLPMASALLFDALLHNIWLAWGAYALGRALKLSRSAAFLTALTFALGGAVSAHIYNGHMTWHAARSWMPWELCALLLYLRGGQRHYALAFALCVVAQIASGYLPISVLSLALCVGLLAAWALTHRAPRPPRGWVGTAAMVAILCGVLSAVFIVPMLEVSRLSVHGDGLNFAEAATFSGSWRTLARLLLPGFFGNNGVQWSIAQVPHEEAAYIGALPLLLALGAPFFARRTGGKLHPALWLLLALLPFAVIMAMGRNLPFYRLAFDYLPLVKKTRVPVRWIELFYYAAALLCGFSFDALIHRRQAGERAERVFARILGGVCVLCAGILVCVALSSPSSEFWRSRAQISPAPAVLKASEVGRIAADLQSAALLESLLGAAFLAGGAYIFAKWRRANSVASRRLERVMLALIAFDLLGLFWRSAKLIAPQSLRQYFTWPKSLTARYDKNQRWETSVASGIINHAALEHVAVLSGYDALGQKRYFQFVGAIEGAPFWAAMYQVNRHSPLLRVAGVSHTLSSSDTAPEVRREFADFRPHLAAREKNYRLWRWDGAWPRVYLTRNVLRAPEDTQLMLLERLSRRDFEIQAHPAVVAPGAFPETVDMLLVPDADVRDWSFSWNRVFIKANAVTPSLLVFSDAYFPGWHAFVNGRETPIEPTNFLFRGLQVPAGASRVEMVYEPETFRIALFLSLCGLAALGALGAAHFTSIKSRKVRPLKSATPN